MNDNNKTTDDTQPITDENVQEGEIVSSDVQDTASQDNAATILESLESLIRENLVKIDKLSEEAKQQSEMLESVLGNDETYKQHNEAAKAAAKVKNATKQQILRRPDVLHVFEKHKELKIELKEIKESMNSYLSEYQRLSGSNEIETPNGVFQIVNQPKLVRARS